MQSAPASRSAGFTIVEVLIALTIFSIAVAGVITVAVRGGMGVNAAKNKVIAAYLADEGIELMRSFRDTSVVARGIGDEALGWADFIADVSGCTASAPCDIDVTNAAGSSVGLFPNSSNILPCSSFPGSLCLLNYDSATGYYVNSLLGIGDPTLFSRNLIVTPISGSTDEVKVIATVSWREGSLTQSLSVSENLFNWY